MATSHFTVTVQRFAHGQDGISAGYRVKVCYTRAHGAEVKGATRVSRDPWSFLVRDGEGGSRTYRIVPVKEFPADNGWSPLYTPTMLKLGACQTGWIAVRHENPDLQWGGIRYAPADFGDVVTWS